MRYDAKLVTKTALALASCAMLSQTAQSNPVNGTFGFVPIGGEVTFSPGTAIGSATSVSIPSDDIINSTPALFLGSPNEFISLLGSSVTITPLSLAIPPVSPITPFLTFGPGGIYSFDETSAAVTRGAGFLSVLMDGTFVDSTHVFANSPADVSFAFTQSAPGAAVNVSFTFEAPPTPGNSIPDGGASLELLGFAVVGLEGLRRKLCS